MSGKDCGQSMFYQHGEVHGHYVHAGCSQKKEGGLLLWICVKDWSSVRPSRSNQALKSPLPLSGLPVSISLLI